MSEIRRKLVIVGDGACGKVSISPVCSAFSTLFTGLFPLDLLVDCLLQRNIPRGMYCCILGLPFDVFRFYPLPIGGNQWQNFTREWVPNRSSQSHSFSFSRFMFQQYLRIMLPMLKLMGNMLNSLYGIRQDRKTMTVFDL